jgi:hypothetical protein
MKQTQEKIDYFAIEAMSNSLLGLIELGPREYKRRVDAGIREESQSLTLGDAVHTKCFEPNRFDEKFVVTSARKVEGMMGVYIEELVKLSAEHPELPSDIFSQQAYEKAGFKIPLATVEKNLTEKPENHAYAEALKLAIGKSPLSTYDMNTIEACISSLSNHKVANELIFGYNHVSMITYNELEILWEYRNMACKSKVDRLIIDPVKGKVVIVDLKTTSKSVYKFESAFDYYQYYRQMAFYLEAVKYWMLYNHPTYTDFEYEVYIPAVQTTGNNETVVYKPSVNALQAGLMKVNTLMNELVWHLQNNLWEYPRNYYEGSGIVELNLKDEKNETEFAEPN